MAKTKTFTIGDEIVLSGQRGWIVQRLGKEEDQFLAKLYQKESPAEILVDVESSDIEVLKLNDPFDSFQRLDFLIAETDDVWVSLRFTNEEWQRIEKVALKESKSVEAFIKQSLIDALEV